MINEVLEVIRQEVNNYIGNKLGDTTNASRVVLTSFVNESGQVAIPSDSVGLSLLNIEEERTFKSGGLVQISKAQSSSSFVSQPVFLNLQIMFTAYFNTYSESLKHISYILSCLQTKPVFDADNTSAMANLNVPKLIFELNTLGLEQQHYIWAMIGLRYLPSVVYRVRMMTVFEQDIINEAPNIQQITTVQGLKEVGD
jgi:hypothetical protein